MYGRGGQQWGVPVNPAAQINNPRSIGMPGPSTSNHFNQNSVDVNSSPGMQLIEWQQPANTFEAGTQLNNPRPIKTEPPAFNSSPDMKNFWQQQASLLDIHTQKLQDDLAEAGLKIKHHEDNIKYLKASKRKLDEAIVNKQVSLGGYGVKKMEGNPAQNSEAQTVEQILKHVNSAAALCLRLKKQAEAVSADHSLTRDVIGVVATLGKVDNENLSRLLSKYLGLETMLAVVCRTYKGVETLEACNTEGVIDKDRGLHAFAASIGIPLQDQFNVICLEHIRPYDGAIVDDDPQRRLLLLKPRLPNGETPPGFLGFAVNMMNIDKTDLHFASKTGHNLRETLFYHLFSNLQVYRSRVDMLKARPLISNGAISLDGGTIRGSGVFTLGHNQQNFEVKFPVSCVGLSPPPLGFVEMFNGLKETKWKRNRTLEDIQTEEQLLASAKANFELKKNAFVGFIAQRSSRMAQTQFYPQPGPSS